MKTYTQKQYDNAKRGAFSKGMKFAETFQMPQDVEESVEQIKSWNKIGRVDDKMITALSIVVIIVILATLFFYMQTESVNALILK